MARLEKQLERVDRQEARLDAEMVTSGQDFERLTELGVRRQELATEREALELEWLDVAGSLD